MDYRSYMSSADWEARKRAYFRKKKKACRACTYYGPDIDLHHLSYVNLGSEPNSDLMALCERCHRFVHMYARRHPRLSLRDATLAAVEAIRLSPRVKRTTGPKEPFIPLRQRLTREQRLHDPLKGKGGQFGGLPITPLQ